MIDRLSPHVAGFSLATVASSDWTNAEVREHLLALAKSAAASGPRSPLLLCVPTDIAPERADGLVDAAVAAGLDGFWVDGAVRADGRREIGRPALEPALATTARLRHRLGAGATLVGSGGVHEPEDALRMIEAGADLVAIDSGLVFSGPGLAKRIGEAVLFADTKPVDPDARGARRDRAVVALGLAHGPRDVVRQHPGPRDRDDARGVALRRAVRGADPGRAPAVNDRLLSFLTHDRVTLAGTMVAIGVLYSGLAWFGMRHGLHWAKVAVLASAFAGSATFFLFLGFGYFDPFHAFVTAVLFQFLLLALHCRLPEPHGLSRPRAAERPGLAARPVGPARAHRARLRVRGRGARHLDHRDHPGLRAGRPGVHANHGPRPSRGQPPPRPARRPRPCQPRRHAAGGRDRLPAHGTLGLPPGARWLWWTTLLAGLPGYAAAIGVHFAVGYMNLFHLTPAFAGLGLFAASMALSYPHLCARDAMVGSRPSP